MLNGTKNDDIILIKRRKAGHGGHHGGAWKVAYADFVTALMSLFIVLWLTSTSDVVKKSIAQYFNDPKGTSTLQGTNRNGAGHSLPMDKSGMEKLKQQLLEAAQQMPNFDKLKNQVEITAEQDGLRIELLEQPGGTFFKLGSAEPTPALRDFLTAISPQLGKMQNRISIEGHTDSVPYSDTSPYTNWELSTDRANAARRLMQSSGVVHGQVAEVRGFADQLPRRPDAPNDPSNRRITLVIEPSSMAEPASSTKELTTGKSMESHAGEIAAASSAKNHRADAKNKVK